MKCGFELCARHATHPYLPQQDGILNPFGVAPDNKTKTWKRKCLWNALLLIIALSDAACRFRYLKALLQSFQCMIQMLSSD